MVETNTGCKPAAVGDAGELRRLATNNPGTCWARRQRQWLGAGSQPLHATPVANGATARLTPRRGLAVKESQGWRRLFVAYSITRDVPEADVQQVMISQSNSHGYGIASGQHNIQKDRDYNMSALQHQLPAMLPTQRALQTGSAAWGPPVDVGTASEPPGLPLQRPAGRRHCHRKPATWDRR
jgi:hypothetical protein